jgi:hypothetical protein
LICKDEDDDGTKYAVYLQNNASISTGSSQGNNNDTNDQYTSVTMDANRINLKENEITRTVSPQKDLKLFSFIKSFLQKQHSSFLYVLCPGSIFSETEFKLLFSICSVLSISVISVTKVLHTKVT